MADKRPKQNELYPCQSGLNNFQTDFKTKKVADRTTASSRYMLFHNF